MALTLLATACGSSPPATSPSSGAPTRFGTPLDAEVPSRLLRLHLTDSSGRPTSLGAMKGKILVVSDVMTLCQETCAIETASMLLAARALDRAGDGRDVVFLSITIDPARDDLAHLAAYRRLFGGLPNWKVLTGSPADIKVLWDRLGVWRQRVRVDKPYPRDWLTGAPLTTDVTHTDDLVFVDGAQRFRYLIDGAGSVGSARAIPHRIYAFMDRLGHQNVRRPERGSWTPAQVEAVLRWMIRDRERT